MKSMLRVPVILLAMISVPMAMPVSSQSYRSALGLTAGGSMHGDLAPDHPVSAKFETGWLVGLQYERWLGAGRTGLRLNTLFTQRVLDRPEYADYNVFMADMDLLVRMLAPGGGPTISPYVAVGAGATRYGAVSGTAQPLGDGIYGSNPVVRAHMLTGIGVDLATSRSMGLRFEVADQIVLPSIGYSPAVSGFQPVHNLLVTGTGQWRMGAVRGGYRDLWPGSGPSVAPVPGDPEELEQRGGARDTVRLAPGDVIRLTVWRQPDFSGEIAIGPEGQLIHPLYRDIRVADLPMDTVETRIREYLQRFEAEPRFVVEPLYQVSIGGAISDPGLHTVSPGSSLGRVLLVAGGTRNNSRKAILTRDGREYDIDLSGRGGDIPVQSGDEIVILERRDVWRDIISPLTSFMSLAVSIANLYYILERNR